MVSRDGRDRLLGDQGQLQTLELEEALADTLVVADVDLTVLYLAEEVVKSIHAALARFVVATKGGLCSGSVGVVSHGTVAWMLTSDLMLRLVVLVGLLVAIIALARLHLLVIILG